VLLVAAEQLELEGIVRRMDAVRPLSWGLDYAIEGSLRAARVFAVANGPGPRLAAHAVTTACDRAPITRVVSTGFCGALDPALPIGGIVTDARKLVSVDRVAVTPEDKAALRRHHEAAVEMEYAGVAAEASRRGLPCSAVRVVSDTASEAMPFDFNQYRRPDGRFDRAAIVRAAIMRPWKFRALLRLQRNCKLASAKLGEFFATCDF
jgi:adenosylhomocysteine nucleosidase